MLSEEKAVVQSLVRAGEVVILKHTEKVPEGCANGFVNDDITVYIKVVGLIDFKAELNRLEKEKDRLDNMKEGVEKKMNDSNYAKVPEKVKKINEANHSKYMTELEAIHKSIADIKKYI